MKPTTTNSTNSIELISVKSITDNLKLVAEARCQMEEYIHQCVDDIRTLKTAWKTLKKNFGLVDKPTNSRVIAIYRCGNCDWVEDISKTKNLFLGSQIQAIKVCKSCGDSVFAHIIEENDYQMFNYAIEEGTFSCSKPRGY
jgi:predicted metal-binding protein